ncbi:hypothetical protein BDW02DRAFT_138507 [Decorospora gaudefroyi]|uniref:Uncharacterized protein n=1 Tax=Decorospora gaudefroyi TaxID=184978 RepID=A0A6A5JXP5_9PLEO|nr:hypothetical protein BDW02DRAFT_138507 [Decorospora gaudefroyi]
MWIEAVAPANTCIPPLNMARLVCSLREATALQAKYHPGLCSSQAPSPYLHSPARTLQTGSANILLFSPRPSSSSRPAPLYRLLPCPLSRTGHPPPPLP